MIKSKFYSFLLIIWTIFYTLFVSACVSNANVVFVNVNICINVITIIKESKRIKMKGSYITSYRKDFQNNKEIDFKGLIMEKLKSFYPAENLRELVEFKSSNYD